jgi:hypothetical protein
MATIKDSPMAVTIKDAIVAKAGSAGPTGLALIRCAVIEESAADQRYTPQTNANQESPMKAKDTIWETKAAEEDYQAAEKYLRLLFKQAKAKQLAQALRRTPCIEYEAKDLLRASQTHLLDKDNPHVAENLKKIKKKKKLSPVLLVRGDGKNGVTVTIADGYHRICAGWHWDETLPVACCLVDLR